MIIYSRRSIVASPAPSLLSFYLMVYISNWFSYAVAVAQVYKADIVSSFLAVPELIKEGAIESGAYYKDLLMLYVFTAIGAVPVIKNQIKGK